MIGLTSHLAGGCYALLLVPTSLCASLVRASGRRRSG